MRKALRHSSQMRASLSHDFLLHTPSLTSYYTHLSGTHTSVALRHSSHHKCVRSLWLSLVTFALSHWLSRSVTRSTQRLFHPLSPTQFHPSIYKLPCHASVLFIAKGSFVGVSIEQRTTTDVAVPVAARLSHPL